jgi:hypothetical protein
VVFADVGKYLLKAGELGRFAVPIRLLSDFGVAHVRLAVCANNDRNPLSSNIKVQASGCHGRVTCD